MSIFAFFSRKIIIIPISLFRLFHNTPLVKHMTILTDIIIYDFSLLSTNRKICRTMSFLC